MPAPAHHLNTHQTVRGARLSLIHVMASIRTGAVDVRLRA